MQPSYQQVGIDYETAARLAGSMLRRLVSMEEDDISETVEETSDLAMTNEYLTDVMAEMRNAGDQVSFDDIYDQAKTAHHLIENEDGSYVVAGTADDPEYFSVDPDLVQRVWQDAEGSLDDIRAVVDGQPAS